MHRAHAERLCLVPGLLPLPVGPGPRLNNAAPSVQFHYRTFIPTTSCSAPVLRIGTPVLAVLAACDLSLNIGTTGSHVPYKSPVELRAAYTPDAARAVFRTTPELIPEEWLAPGFDPDLSRGGSVPALPRTHDNVSSHAFQRGPMIVVESGRFDVTKGLPGGSREPVVVPIRRAA